MPIPVTIWNHLIERGTGLLIPRAKHRSGGAPDILDADARQVSWSRAGQFVAEIEQAYEITADPVRFGILRLADIALARYRLSRGTPIRLSTISRRLKLDRVSHTDAFFLVHGLSRAGRNRPGAPSHSEELAIISGLAWYLTGETNRPRANVLAKIVHAIYPPLFILTGGSREAWRQLSEAISKYRKGTDGEADYDVLVDAMKKAGVFPT